MPVAKEAKIPTEGNVYIPKLMQPRDHKAKVIVWADLTVDDVDRLNESLNVDHNKQVLADIFHLDAWKEDPKQAIVMDLYYYTLQFARDNKFNREKLSAFFSIIKKTHEVAIETPFGNLEHTFRYFKNLVLCHAVNRPPHSIELFNIDEVRKMSEYAITTYFRHFKMYKYAFTPLVRLDLTINYHGVPDPAVETYQAPDGGEDKQDEETGGERPSSEAAPPAEGEAMEDDGVEQEGDKDEAASQQLSVVSEGVEDADDDDDVVDHDDHDETQSGFEEESEARKELRAMIQTYLAEEIKKVKISVEEQLRLTEDTIGKKIEASDVLGGGKKTPQKDSAKKKK